MSPAFSYDRYRNLFAGAGNNRNIEEITLLFISNSLDSKILTNVELQNTSLLQIVLMIRNLGLLVQSYETDYMNVCQSALSTPHDYTHTADIRTKQKRNEALAIDIFQLIDGAGAVYNSRADVTHSTNSVANEKVFVVTIT